MEKRTSVTMATETSVLLTIRARTTPEVSPIKIFIDLH